MAEKTIPRVIADFTVVTCSHCMSDVNKYLKLDNGKVSLNLRCTYCGKYLYRKSV